MNTAAAELEVPQDSIAELLCAMKGYRAESTRNDVVRAIATPVVAAELRRLLGQYFRQDIPIVTLIESRIAQLDPQEN